MSKDKNVKESAQYDNFVGRKENNSPISLDQFGLEVSGTDPQSPNVHWVGMPEYEQDHKKPYKTLYVNFRNKEDYKEFSDKIGQTLTEKTRSIWHPKNEVTKNALMRWIEE